MLCVNKPAGNGNDAAAAANAAADARSMDPACCGYSAAGNGYGSAVTAGAAGAAADACSMDPAGCGYSAAGNRNFAARARIAAADAGSIVSAGCGYDAA